MTKHEYVYKGDTIRLMPENYLVAHRHRNHRHWVCDPDLGLDPEKASFVFNTIFNDYDLRRGSGVVLADTLNIRSNR